jgi:protein-tyrosine phosphatase
MEDLHSHLLYGIDDGSMTIEESLAILRKMEANGIKEIVLTPHYIENSKYNCDNYEKVKLYQEFMERVEQENINIRMYLGNEVFITPNIVELFEKGEIAPINGSRYILFEIPLRQVYTNTKAIISDMVSHGYIPILAHPERYAIFQEHPNLVEEYLMMGVLLQGNFTSLFGKYGKKAEKTLKYFLKKKWISFLGSDTHHNYKYPVDKLEKKLYRITRDKKYIKDLFYNNFDKVIENQDITMIR